MNYPTFNCQCGFSGNEGDLLIADASTGHYGYCPQCHRPCDPGYPGYEDTRPLLPNHPDNGSD